MGLSEHTRAACFLALCIAVSAWGTASAVEPVPPRGRERPRPVTARTLMDGLQPLVHGQIGRSGHRVSVLVSSGLHESAESRIIKLVAGLGLPRDGVVRALRAGLPVVFDVGGSRLEVEPSPIRLPTLLQLARAAARGEELPTEARTERTLLDIFGRMNFRHRGLRQYSDMLGARFIPMLQSLSPSDRILVLGAGMANFEKDLLGNAHERLWGVLASEKLCAPWIVSVDLGEHRGALHPKHDYITGFFSRISNKRLLAGGHKKFKAVIDVVGVSTYSPTLSRDLQKALDVLEKGHEAWIVATDSVVIYDQDRIWLLPDWLATHPGLEVTFQRPERRPDGTYLPFSVRKLRDDVKITELDLLVERGQHERYGRALSTVQIFRHRVSTAGTGRAPWE